MFTRLEDLYKSIDKATAQIASTHKAAIKCHKGCADCCHAAFDVSLIEAYYLLQAFRQLPRKVRRQALKEAEKAQKQWEEMLNHQSDISRTRIRCPLLDKDDTCTVYSARPVNCRTYGVPTEIQGKGHVCILSGFQQGVSYPTIKLDQIQQVLLDLSTEMNPKMGQKRWPVASILLSEKQ